MFPSITGMCMTDTTTVNVGGMEIDRDALQYAVEMFKSGDDRLGSCYSDQGKVRVIDDGYTDDDVCVTVGYDVAQHHIPLADLQDLVSDEEQETVMAIHFISDGLGDGVALDPTASFEIVAADAEGGSNPFIVRFGKDAHVSGYQNTYQDGATDEWEYDYYFTETEMVEAVEEEAEPASGLTRADGE